MKVDGVGSGRGGGGGGDERGGGFASSVKFFI